MENMKNRKEGTLRDALYKIAVMLALIAMMVIGSSRIEAEAGEGVYTAWDGIEWNFSGSTLYIRRRSGGDGTCDAVSSYSDYPWSYLSGRTSVIDVANNVHSIGAEAFYSFSAGTIYLRYNGNMSIGNLAFHTTGPYKGTANFHIAAANKNARNVSRARYYYSDFIYDLGTTGSWYAWDGIEWCYTGTRSGGSLLVRKRSGGDGTCDAVSSHLDYPWSHLAGNASVIDVANNVHAIGAEAFYSFSAGTIYLRYNGNMSIGNLAFHTTGPYKGTANFYIWTPNTNARNVSRARYYYSNFIYFNNVGASCSHPWQCVSGWQTSGENHYRACTQCGSWSTSHNRNGNWKWQYNGSNHWKYCNVCGITWSSAGHGFGGWYGNTATCTAGGTQYRKCGTCGYVASAATSALGHNYGAEYSENGQIKKKCTRCNHVIFVRYISYTVKYNGNGETSGSTASSVHTYETEKALTPNGFVKTGHTFIGWNSNEAGTGTNYSDQQLVKNLTTDDNGTVNLYAQWRVNQYPVTYIVYDETQNKELIRFERDIDYDTTVKGSDIDSELNPDTNHVFYVSGDDRPYRLNMEGNIETAAKVTVTGATVYRYCRLNEIKVMLDLNKPAASEAEPNCSRDSIIVIPLQPYGTLPEPELLDYQFDGWYTEAAGGKKITAESIVNATREHTLYAHWIAKPPVIVDTTANPEVIEYLGVEEAEYIKQYGPLSSDLIQEGKLQYPYSKTKIAAYTGGGVAEDGSTNHWTWQISTDGTTWNDLLSEGETRTEANGVTYRTYPDDAEAGTFYLEIDHAVRSIHNTKYRIVLKNNAGSSTSDPITLFVYWLPGY